MRIVLAGASGFLGTRLSSRSSPPVDMTWSSWCAANPVRVRSGGIPTPASSPPACSTVPTPW